VVRSASVDYVASARLDDEVKLILNVEKLGRASVQFAQQAWRGDTLLSSADVKVGCIDAPRCVPVPFPTSPLLKCVPLIHLTKYILHERSPRPLIH
jgi:acyl-CoA thioester hydrolase